eukprot:8032199-Karenia_brevis.AAC.1
MLQDLPLGGQAEAVQPGFDSDSPLLKWHMDNDSMQGKTIENHSKTDAQSNRSGQQTSKFTKVNG